ncbi:MAG: creatininase family protein [Deltaproteobacteria bacterium]|nr:creatininase family protein [Deltaproteobacteria bacterium]
MITLLENLSYPEVEEYLKKKDIVLVPTGSVEQHSPYGLIGTDFITAESVARRVAEKMHILVAPTVNYGVSPHHMSFKGTVSLAPDTMILIISDIIESLATHGFRRVVFINGHGGNISSIKIAMERSKVRMIKGCFQIISWYEMEEVQRLCTNLFHDQEGHHATPSEVSITKYLREEAFETKSVQKLQVKNPTYHWPLTCEEMKKVFPDGRMESAPWLASAGHGRKILEEASRAIKKKIEEICLIKLL